MKDFGQTKAELALRRRTAQRIGTVARPGTQFAIIRDSPVPLRRGGSHHRSRIGPGSPGLAGSSHESLDGIADSGRFFLSDDLAKSIAKFWRITKRRWVIAYEFRTCSA